MVESDICEAAQVRAFCVRRGGEP
eukprot:COSAG01_NODE_67218_length_267_cov_2.083333_1_plen_23_part_01